MLTDQLRKGDLCLFVLFFMVVSGCRLTPLIFRLRVIDTYKGLMMIVPDITWSRLVVVFFEHFIS